MGWSACFGIVTGMGPDGLVSGAGASMNYEL